MPYIPTPINGDDVLRIWYRMRLAGQEVQTVLHARVSFPGAGDYQTQIGDIANALASDEAGVVAGWGLVRSNQSNQLEYRELRVQRVFPVRDIYVSRLLSNSGATITDSAPPNLAMTSIKRSVLPDRHGHGDLHLPGLPLNKITDGLWDLTFKNVIEGILEDYLTTPYDAGAGASTINWCIFSQTGANVGGQDIIDVVTSDIVTTMHRRTVGLGI